MFMYQNLTANTELGNVGGGGGGFDWGRPYDFIVLPQLLLYDQSVCYSVREFSASNRCWKPFCGLGFCLQFLKPRKRASREFVSLCPYGMDDLGSRFRFPEGLGIFLFTTASRMALGPTNLPILWISGALSLGLKRPGREADNSPPSSTEIKE
jgi:hypothetical protein